ncbi:hypothetical protein [Lentibacter algarum]|uniref:hypothetical protein n=1 Tax=Lentibacter algarum TaxID=576131 RepID=UPI003AF695F8
MDERIERTEVGFSLSKFETDGFSADEVSWYTKRMATAESTQSKRVFVLSYESE